MVRGTGLIAGSPGGIGRPGFVTCPTPSPAAKHDSFARPTSALRDEDLGSVRHVGVVAGVLDHAGCGRVFIKRARCSGRTSPAGPPGNRIVASGTARCSMSTARRPLGRGRGACARRVARSHFSGSELGHRTQPLCRPVRQPRRISRRGRDRRPSIENRPTAFDCDRSGSSFAAGESSPPGCPARRRPAPFQLLRPQRPRPWSPARRCGARRTGGD